MTSPVNPTLIEIAQTIVAAAALHDEDPLDIASGAMGSRARWLAFAALIEAFPAVDYRKIALLCGFTVEQRRVNSRAEMASARAKGSWKWWIEADLRIVKAALARAIAETDRSVSEILTPSLEAEKVIVDAAPAADPPALFTVTLLETGGAETAVSEPENPAVASNPAPIAAAHFLSPPADDRAAAAARMKAWAAGDPPRVAEVEIGAGCRIVGKPPVAMSHSSTSGDAEKRDIAPVDRAPAQPNPKISPICQPSAAAVSIASAARDMRATKAKPKPPAAPINALVDERRPINPLARALAAERDRGVTSFKPDRPAHERGAVVIPVAGEPAPGRSALDQRGVR